MKLKILIILVFSLFSLVLIYAQETIIDTIFVAGPPLTGEISNFNYNYELQVDFLALTTGDTGVPWIPPYVPNAVFRTYLTFLLDSLNIENEIDSIKLILWSGTGATSGIVGNDIWGEWPVWDVPGGDTIKCCVDHVDFGNYLDLGDWAAGDYGDPQTLESKCAFIIPEVYNPETGYIIVDVTTQVLNDIEYERNKSQFRIGFEINTDGDSMYDIIEFRKNMIEPEKAPHLNIYENPDSNYVDNVINSFDEIKMSNFPNPFNPKTTIYYQITHPGIIKLQIYNIKGQLIETIVNECQREGKHSIIWNAENQASGIYYCKLVNVEDGRLLSVKKVTLLK